MNLDSDQSLVSINLCMSLVYVIYLVLIIHLRNYCSTPAKPVTWHLACPTQYKLYGTNHDSAHNTSFHLFLVIYNNMPFHKTSFLAGLVLRTPTGTPVVRPVNWYSPLEGPLVPARISSKSLTKLFQIFYT